MINSSSGGDEYSEYLKGATQFEETMIQPASLKRVLACTQDISGDFQTHLFSLKKSDKDHFYILLPACSVAGIIQR